ncbi:thiol:disulfide interchange protein DsbA/DsbL [Massilia sp. erpn]|uniref:thiol:disulfide interchange protein DsbA/DsbL n=1 Tax=Massilia sp. erpn TaxID=2738142 RepID=UPI002105F8BF|nr:thiol:disulfide interchange protein DsbA/DsbL [Massilia sp. erpn]UTY56442.1 thiol:disulfide interchange protein DsbA/DsbL [Massilia sp. erpn]
MQLLKKILAVLALCSVALGASASPADPKNGVEYTTLPTPQNTDTGKKIEVIEFFAYYCPHCNAFEPSLAEWVRKQGDNIVFKRVHVPYDNNTLPQQRLFYTLEALGLLEQYHAKVFAAMHKERNRLRSDDAVFEWAAKNGIERNKFADAYNSFGVAAKVRRSGALMEAYKIDSWPAIVIDGRFQTAPHMAHSAAGGAQDEAAYHQSAMTVMDYLVAKAKSEKK